MGLMRFLFVCRYLEHRAFRALLRRPAYVTADVWYIDRDPGDEA